MARGYTVTEHRRQQVAEARRLRAEGLLQREIAERMGLSRSSVSDLFSDPDRVKANRRRLDYGGRCEVCGEPTDGSGGRRRTRVYCSDHAGAASADWTKESILAAIARYVAENGHQPISHDWLYDRPGYAPATGTVLRHFGSWSAAMRAAGFESRTGIKFRPTSRRKQEMFKVYAEIEEGTWRELGEYQGNRQQAVQAAVEALPESERPSRVMTIHPNAVAVNPLRPVQKVVYELAVDGE